MIGAGLDAGDCSGQLARTEAETGLGETRGAYFHGCITRRPPIDTMATPDAQIVAAIRAERWGDAASAAEAAIAASAPTASTGTLRLYAGVARSKLGDATSAEAHFLAAAGVPDTAAKGQKALLDLYATTGACHRDCCRQLALPQRDLGGCGRGWGEQLCRIWVVKLGRGMGGWVWG